MLLDPEPDDEPDDVVVLSWPEVLLCSLSLLVEELEESEDSAPLDEVPPEVELPPSAVGAGSQAHDNAKKQSNERRITLN